jgi:23S rRNA (cytosine1962-C5)-methyltransferase
MHGKDLVTEPWDDYELLDSGDGEKLERFGEVVLARPETQALWAKRRPELWERARAVFVMEGGKGRWETRQQVPEAWELAWEDARFAARLTSFKHTGLFPEQSPNWKWTAERVAQLKLGHPMSKFPQVLNLFGYTGIASVVAAQAGAKVTHVDASKQSLDWASDNARRSGLPDDAIRWIPDDALAFARRELRRGTRYDGIILDPPAFGRGTKGEVWKIEASLPKLLATLHDLLAREPGAFLLLNGYAAGYAPRAFAQALQSAFPDTALEYGELQIREADAARVIPAGIYARFVR